MIIQFKTISILNRQFYDAYFVDSSFVTANENEILTLDIFVKNIKMWQWTHFMNYDVVPKKIKKNKKIKTHFMML